MYAYPAQSAWYTSIATDTRQREEQTEAIISTRRHSVSAEYTKCFAQFSLRFSVSFIAP